MSTALLEAHYRTVADSLRPFALGAALLVTSVFAFIMIGRSLDGIPLVRAFDERLYAIIHLGTRSAWLDALVSPFNFNFLPWAEAYLPSFLYVIFIVSFIYIAIKHRRAFPWALIALLIAIALDDYLFKIFHATVIRDRPFVRLPNAVPEGAKAIWVKWPTYTSGHVRDLAMFSTVLAGYARELRWPFIALIVWVGFTRVYLGAHYPTDVIAGWGLGVLVGIAILLMMKPLQVLYQRGMHHLTKRSKSTI